MSWFSRAVDRGVKAGVETALEKHLPGLIDKAIARVISDLAKDTSTDLGFCACMATEFMRVDCTLAFGPAMNLAGQTLRRFLKDERIEFGDPDYGWEPSDARNLAQEMEIEHWEAVAP